MAPIITSNPEYNRKDRDQLCRIVFLFVFGSLLYSYYSHTMLHQLQQPALIYPYVDLTYWLLHLLAVPEWITGNTIVARLLDHLLLVSALLGILLPAKRLNMVLFLLLYFLYFIIYNTYGMHHTSNKVGILVIAIPFLVKDIRSFNLLWQALRYFLLFVFSCAFLWKFLRWSWLQPDQGLLIMKKNLADYLYFNPETWLAYLSRWFLQHPTLVNGLFIAGVVLEGVFIIGFFTRKYDHWLLLMGILLLLGFWFMAHAVFFEMLILFLPLVRFDRIHFFQQFGQRADEVATAR